MAIFERFANRFIVAVDGLVLVLVLVLVLKFDVFCKTRAKFLGNFRESLFVVVEEKGATHVSEFALCPYVSGCEFAGTGTRTKTGVVGRLDELLVTLTDLFDGGVGDVDGCLRHFVRVVGSLLLALYSVYRIIFISIFCLVEIEMQGENKK